MTSIILKLFGIEIVRSSIVSSGAPLMYLYFKLTTINSADPSLKIFLLL